MDRPRGGFRARLIHPLPPFTPPAPAQMIATLDRPQLELDFLRAFDAREGFLRSELPGFRELRERSVAAFDRLGFPSTRDEDWKYTDPRAVLGRSYVLPDESESDMPTVAFQIDGLDAHRLVFHNGRFRPGSSSVGDLPDGVVVCALSEAAQRHPDLASRYLGRWADPDENAFVALNTALFSDGAFVYVPDGVELDKPVLVVHRTDSDRDAVVFPRGLYVAGDASALTVLEVFEADGGPHLSIPVTELGAGAETRLRHYRLQNEGADSAQISMLRGYQTDASDLGSVTATFSGRLVRNTVHLHPDGEHCETHLGGLYLLDGRQHVDNHTFIDHSKPHCESNELFKGILDDRASSAFSGMLLVRRLAQKTNAFQENKTILLTDDASSYAKPQLEIYADDVRCSHGATTGEVDPEALFYFRARGISEEQARNMLLFAFVSDVAEMIDVPPLHDFIVDLLHKRLD